MATQNPLHSSPTDLYSIVFRNLMERKGRIWLTKELSCSFLLVISFSITSMWPNSHQWDTIKHFLEISENTIPVLKRKSLEAYSLHLFVNLVACCSRCYPRHCMTFKGTRSEDIAEILSRLDLSRSQSKEVTALIISPLNLTPNLWTCSYVRQ